MLNFETYCGLIRGKGSCVYISSNYASISLWQAEPRLEAPRQSNVRGFFYGTPRHKQRALVWAAGKEADRSERRPDPPNCLLDEEAINRESPVRPPQGNSESWPLAIPDNLNDTEPKLLLQPLRQTLEVQVWGLGRPMVGAIENTYCPINGNSFWRQPFLTSATYLDPLMRGQTHPMRNRARTVPRNVPSEQAADKGPWAFQSDRREILRTRSIARAVAAGPAIRATGGNMPDEYDEDLDRVPYG